MTEKYNISNFISPCCGAFNYYDAEEIHCSHCKKVISTITGDDCLTIMIKYNMNPFLGSISEDIVNEFNQNASRYAHDCACEKITKKCPKCNHAYCRYMRNPKGIIVYICEKCRNVFSDI